MLKHYLTKSQGVQTTSTPAGPPGPRLDNLDLLDMLLLSSVLQQAIHFANHLIAMSPDVYLQLQLMHTAPHTYSYAIPKLYSKSIAERQRRMHFVQLFRSLRDVRLGLVGKESFPPMFWTFPKLRR